MESSKEPFNAMGETVSKTMKQTQGAMDNYFSLFQNAMSLMAWNDLNKKLKDYAEQNITAAFEFSKKLMQAKDLQDLIRIQTKLMQAQFNAFSEQAKDLGETANRAAVNPFKVVFGPSS